MFHFPDIFLLCVKALPSTTVPPEPLIQRNVNGLSFVLSLVDTVIIVIIIIIIIITVAF